MTVIMISDIPLLTGLY